jgi:hypothetical protein
MNEQDCVEQADGFVNGVETFDVGEQPSEPPVHREEDEPRLRRIADYEAVALAKENPFEAVMQATSAGLMRIELRLQKAIEQAMKMAPVTPERIRTLAPTFDLHLKYARQIDRYGQVVRRLAASGQIADPASGGNVVSEAESE